jgi:transposase InsO family protein
MRFQFIAAEEASYPVRTLCRCLQVSRSGYYAWRHRGPSARALADVRLTAQLRLAHAESRQAYGRPRLVRALRGCGIAVGGNRVARLMRTAGLRARGRRRFITTTDSAHRLPVVPNRLRQRFDVRRLNRVWAADITACWTHQGWCYLAVVMDLASRRVIGWAVRRAATTDLPVAALSIALAQRRPGAKLIHHSDRGAQYASDQYRALLARHRITPSMSRVRNCWDNAPVESFFSSLKTELLPERPWPDTRVATTALADYIDFYNRQRLHSTLGYRSPVAFETELAKVV